MTDDLARSVDRRVRSLRADFARALATAERPVAMFEIIGGSDDVEEDIKLARAAIRSGADANEFAPLLVAALTELTYRVDWGDQFRFWPILGESFGEPRLDLGADHGARRAVADAFRRVTSGGVHPQGEFGAQFPLMSWPLAHTIVPRCAQRHAARVLQRAATRGLIPPDLNAAWPVDDIVAVAEELSAPLFVRGIIESATVLAVAGQALLGNATSGDRAPWIRRLMRDFERDATTRAMVADARARVSRAPRRGGTRAGRSRMPMSASLDLREGEAHATLSITVGPCPKAFVSGLEPDARAGAHLRVVANKKTTLDAGALWNVLSEEVVVPLPDPPRERTTFGLRAVAYEGELREETVRSLETSELAIELPLVMRDDGGRLRLAPDRCVTSGERIAIVVATASAHARDLETAGFSRVAMSPSVAALVGRAQRGAVEALNVEVVDPIPTLTPIVVPPARVEDEVLVYGRARDVWLRLDHGPRRPRAEALSGDASVPLEIGSLGDGAWCMVLRADTLPVASDVALAVYEDQAKRPTVRATLRVDASPSQDIALSRWEVRVQPVGASVESMTQGLCWLHVDAPPELGLEIEVELDGSTASARIDRESRTPFSSAALMRSLVTQLSGGETSSFKCAHVRARAPDEALGWREVATLAVPDAPMRFELRDDKVAVVASDVEPQLARLDVRARGIEETAVDLVDATTTPGVYVATSGTVRAALCVGQHGGRLPRSDLVVSSPRGKAALAACLSTLRAVEIGLLSPARASGHARLVRGDAVRSLERCLVAALCGEAWLAMEDTLLMDHEPAELTARVGPLLWVPRSWLEGWCEEASDDDGDPSVALDSALVQLAIPKDARRWAHHLLLCFYARGMCAPRYDADALAWAWSDVQRARVVRAAYLANRSSIARARARGAADD